MSKKHDQSSVSSISRRTAIKSTIGLAVAGVASSTITQPALAATETTRNSKKASFADLKSQADFDLCVIGSGPAGISLALDMAKAGTRVLVLESGFDLGGEEFDERLHGLESYEVSGDLGYPVRTTRMRALGGTANMWTGRCSRFHPADFEPNAYTPSDNPWPIRYSDIQPYYKRAEKTLNVYGGKLSEYHAPRTFDLPAESGNIDMLKAMAKDIGVTVDWSPSSHGLKGDGPVRVDRDWVPELLELPNAMLVTGVTVTSIDVTNDSVVGSLTVRNLANEVLKINAKQYVVACGGVETTRLLLLSKSEKYPNGIANNNDNLGRYFTVHPNLGFSGKTQIHQRFEKPKHEMGRIHQFYDEFKKKGLGSPLFVFYRTPKPADSLVPQSVRRWMSGSTPAIFRISVTVELQPVAENRIRLSDTIKDSFGNPGTHLALSYTEKDKATFSAVRNKAKEIFNALDISEITEKGNTWSHHHLGGCRMGDNAATSIVDKNLTVHGVPNLHILSSAVYVTGGGTHPTLGIVALAHRLSDHLLKKST